MTVNPDELTGAKVRELRDGYGLSRDEFSRLCGFPTQTRLSNIEFKDSWKDGNREIVARVLSELEANPPSHGRKKTKTTGEPRVKKRESAEERLDRLEGKLRENGKLLREQDIPQETVIPNFDDAEEFNLVIHDDSDVVEELPLPTDDPDEQRLRALETEAPSPPEGWFWFGTHAAFDVPKEMLEFSSDVDNAGVPLWERPVTQPEPPVSEPEPPPLIQQPIVEAPRVPDHVRDISPFRSDLKLISNSEVETMKRCRRKWWLAWYRKLAPGTEDLMGARAIGRRVHRALAAYYVPEGETPVDPRDALERAIVDDWTIISQNVTDETTLAELAGKFTDTCGLERAMIEGYVQWLEESGSDQNLLVTASETPLAAVLEADVHGEKREFQAIGLIDSRVTRSLDGVRLFVDHKTVPDFTKPGKTLHMNAQMKHYHLLEWLNTEDGEARCDGALYNMLRKVKRTARANPPFYARVEVRHSPIELESYKRSLLGATRDIMLLEDALNAGADPLDVAYPSVRDECSWDCDFFAVCPMFDDGSRAEDMLAGLYHNINPLARYDYLETRTD